MHASSNLTPDQIDEIKSFSMKNLNRSQHVLNNFYEKSKQRNIVVKSIVLFNSYLLLFWLKQRTVAIFYLLGNFYLECSSAKSLLKVYINRVIARFEYADTDKIMFIGFIWI